MTQDELKRAVAAAAVGFVTRRDSGCRNGLDRRLLHRRARGCESTGAAAVSSSERSTRRLEACGIRVVDLNEVAEISVYVDGADEIDRASR